jgi:hypothetical protein
LKLSTRESVDSSIQQVRNREGESHLLHSASTGGRWVATHLQWKLNLGSDGRGDNLGLGVLSHVAHRCCQLARAGSDGVDAGNLNAAVNFAAVEVRDEPAGSLQER